MHFLELAAQGIKGFSPSCRVPLKPGYWVLKGPAGAAPLCSLTLAILHSDGRGGDTALLAAGAKQGRVAFSLQGNDQNFYRVVRNLGGAGALQRLNPETQQQELVTEDAGEIATVLKAQGLPSRVTFEGLFCLVPQQLPTSKAKGRALAKSAIGGSGPKPAPGLQSAMSVEPTSDIPGSRAKLAELEKELVFSQEVGELQFKIDGLASDCFGIEQQLAVGEKYRSQIAEVDAEIAKAPTAARISVPSDIVAKLERYPQQVAKLKDSLKKLEQEQPTEETAVPRRVPPLWKDERFRWGVGVGTVTLLGGMLFSGWGRYIALLDVPAFGFAALVALQWVDALQGTQKASDKGSRIEARGKKLREQFELEAGDAKRAMAALDADTPAEALAALAVVAPLQAKRQALEDQLTALEQDPEFVALRDKLQQAKSEMEALNAQLTEKGGNYFREAREVEREIARTRQSITLAESAMGIAAEPSAAPDEGAEDPAPALLTTASQLFNTDIAGVSVILKERSAQYLVALSDKKYLGAEIDLQGRASLLTAGRRIPASELPGKDLDLLYLCLKLTLLEKYSARYKVPILIEDGPYVEEAKQALLGRMLRHLGTLTQVLHVSASPAFAGVADGTAGL